ncbi:hypothetical protein C8R44DRAFT_982076 [Mycena epipterygia]|nr:hypothetical protein C8R44DRAFT_982074 [Mycena epipterygia]KAJ7120219.1 hypothetical protein C8R44DRAFT_982076 [Mycena epipterygia]
MNRPIRKRRESNDDAVAAVRVHIKDRRSRHLPPSNCPLRFLRSRTPSPAASPTSDWFAPRLRQPPCPSTLAIPAPSPAPPTEQIYTILSSTSNPRLTAHSTTPNSRPHVQTPAVRSPQAPPPPYLAAIPPPPCPCTATPRSCARTAPTLSPSPALCRSTPKSRRPKSRPPTPPCPSTSPARQIYTHTS